jgi:hypothetical protein
VSLIAAVGYFGGAGTYLLLEKLIG